MDGGASDQAEGIERLAITVSPSTDGRSKTRLDYARMSIDRWNRRDPRHVEMRTAGVLLFGSHAKRTARANSDLDFLVLVDAGLLIQGDGVFLTSEGFDPPCETSFFDSASMNARLER